MNTVELARAAGVHPLAMSEEYLPGLERLVALARAAERERIKAANAPAIKNINEHIKTLEKTVADERLVAAAVAAEREACAQVGMMKAINGIEVAAAIRARSDT